jgi:hypothetical protein
MEQSKNNEMNKKLKAEITAEITAAGRKLEAAVVMEICWGNLQDAVKSLQSAYASYHDIIDNLSPYHAALVNDDLIPREFPEWIEGIGEVVKDWEASKIDADKDFKSLREIVDGVGIKVTIKDYPLTVTFNAELPPIDGDEGYKIRTKCVQEKLQQFEYDAPHAPTDFVVERVEVLAYNKEVWYLGS